jgi:hypothetical protein
MQVLLTPACGRDGTSSLSPTQSDEEWRKRLTSVLLDQPEVVAIDNVVGLFESAALASAVTATTWHDRLLGVGLDSFAEDELLPLVRKLRGEVAALGWGVP